MSRFEHVSRGADGGPLQLAVTGNQIQLQRCSLYAHEHAMLEAHHVCPESWWRAAGKPTDSPLRILCPNCHYSTHVAIDGLIRGRDVSRIPKRCVTLARLALDLAEVNGLRPAATL